MIKKKNQIKIIIFVLPLLFVVSRVVEGISCSTLMFSSNSKSMYSNGACKIHSFALTYNGFHQMTIGRGGGGDTTAIPHKD